MLSNPGFGIRIRSLQRHKPRKCSCCKEEIRNPTSLQAKAAIVTCGKPECKVWAVEERKRRKRGLVQAKR